MSLATIIFVGISVLVVAGQALLLKRFYHSVAPHEALVITITEGHRVSFTGALVVPFVQRADVLSTAPVEVRVQCADAEACRTADNLKVNLDVTFWVKINRTADDVLRVAQHHGCEKASDAEFVRELFGRKFREALRVVVRRMAYEELDRDLPRFREQVLLMLGEDQGGFIIEDLVVESCGVTPPEYYDENDPLDREGLAQLNGTTDDSSPQEAVVF